jgi:hypothetical protein
VDEAELLFVQIGIESGQDGVLAENNKVDGEILERTDSATA